ncbi:hypothetical protein NBT05_11995 [Aquimarina sp. ERC-38]|uniref:hypothetical protein n=1 Tax=Aquimarina sp. ERC-38 TaxID=2949996 RepID=UPI00224709D6|nr:hypothetical protein [Aquimarina sp. ERC-38]UZO79673.1 hypothetical protein NBT05_11995 [Aquimarina sp. ERC-38]
MNAKGSLENNLPKNNGKPGKVTAIVAYITIIGTIISLFMNQPPDKSKFATFHIRQALGLWITFYVLTALAEIFHSGLVYFGFYIFSVVLIVYGLLSAIREEQTEVPIVGSYFQKWFTFVT